MEHAAHGHWHTTTMVSAIRLTGVEAPMVIDGAMDSLVFRGYIEDERVSQKTLLRLNHLLPFIVRQARLHIVALIVPERTSPRGELLERHEHDEKRGGLGRATPAHR